MSETTGAGAPLTLEEIAAVLGTAKSTASRLRAGRYEHSGELVARYAALTALVDRRMRAAAGAQAPGALCRACPRDDCTGCRVAELYEGGGAIGGGR